MCRHFAAECVTSVSCDGKPAYNLCAKIKLHLLESIRYTIASSDKAVWASLISGLSFQDSSVQASTAQALGMLACDQLARKQVIDCQLSTLASFFFKDLQ